MITIGIPTYSGAWRLNNLLKSLEMRTPELQSGEARIVVVDDGSPAIDQTRRVVEEWKGKLPIDFVEHGSNRGISAGWNTATRYHPSEIVALINDDVIVPSGGWLRSLTHVLRHSPGVGAVGAQWHAFIADDVAQLLASPDSDAQVIPRDPGPTRPQDPSRRQHELSNPGRVMAAPGQLFAIRRADFDCIGGFDEGYRSFYEETCYGTALAAKVGKISVVVSSPMCWHMWSKTFSENPELRAGERLLESRARYRAKWGVPDEIPQGEECGQWTNPRFMGAIGDVEVAFIRGGVEERGILRRDGAFVKE